MAASIIISPPQKPQTNVVRQPRSSNLELYRIMCMLMIVAHHFIVNSGVAALDGPITGNSPSVNSIFLLLLGAWGKTGINCFLMITGYFMCKSEISIRKFLKLLLQIYFYKIVIFAILSAAGYEAFTLMRLLKLAMPLWGLKGDFIGCFLLFYLTIPFWNVLINNMTKRQHQLLLILLLGCYTVLGTVPAFTIRFNYVTWFGIVYLIASYIRLYPCGCFDKRALWGWLTVTSVILSVLSILCMNMLFPKMGVVKGAYYFLSDCNRILAVAVAVCSFLWFKNMNIKYSKIINAFGAATFGVLLIHANSNAMRIWLWKDTIDVIGHYALPLGYLVLFSIGVVLAVFVICNLIDQLRIATLEKWFFRWYDNKLSAKVDALVERITSFNNG